MVLCRCVTLSPPAVRGLSGVVAVRHVGGDLDLVHNFIFSALTKSSYFCVAGEPPVRQAESNARKKSLLWWFVWCLFVTDSLGKQSDKLKEMQ